MAGDPERAAIERSVELMAQCGEPCGFYSSDAIKQNSESHFDAFTWRGGGRTISVDRTGIWSQFDEIREGPRFGLNMNQQLIRWRIDNSSNPFVGQKYRFLFGSHDAAVYIPISEWKAFDFTLPLDLVLHEPRSPHFLSMELRNYLSRATTTLPAADYFHSLMALEIAAHVYSELPDGEIDLSIFKEPLHKARWAQSALLEQHKVNRREQALACIAFLDTGVVDLDPGDFQNVLAISSTNTIYASEALFLDPYNPAPAGRLRRVIGNVGKPGLSLLISPQVTLSREPEIESWELVNHARFDGSIVDTFKGTSLHLSLTGYEMPLNIGDHGTRDKEAFYIEAVVSAYDRGAWVADVDLLSLAQDTIVFNSAIGRFTAHRQNVPCLPDQCMHSSTEKADRSEWLGATAIYSWHGYLDLPCNAAIVRAKGNWTARLALVAVAIAKGKSFLVAKDAVCWACVEHMMEVRKIEMDEVLLVC